MNNFIKWAILSLQAMIFIGFSLGSIILVISVAIPHITRAIELRSEVENLKQNISQAASQMNTLKELKNQDLEQRVIVLLANLPVEFNISFIISAVKKLAEEIEVKVVNVEAVVQENMVPMNNTPDVDVQEISITINSDEPNKLVRFIDQLQSITPIMLIKQYSYNAKAEQSEIKLSIESYAYSEPLLEKQQNSESEPLIPPQFTAKEEQLYEELANRRHFEFIPTYITGDMERVNPF